MEKTDEGPRRLATIGMEEWLDDFKLDNITDKKKWWNNDGLL